MKRLMFVDDESNLLSGLRRMLRAQRGEWEMTFVENGSTALALLAEHSYDAVVSDMRMPAMDGAELLREVRHRSPEVVRLCLSGFSDRSSTLRGLESIHQFMTKPCDSAEMVNRVRAILSSAHALPLALRTRLAGLSALPSEPARLARVRELLQVPEPDLRALGDEICADLGLSCRVVQLVESGFFGLSRHVAGVQAACQLLGGVTLRLIAEQPGGFSEGAPEEAERLRSLGQRCSAAAARARTLAEKLGLPARLVDQASLAAQLHLLGPLAAAACQADEEHESAAAAFLLHLWGVPDPVREGVLYRLAPWEVGAEVGAAHVVYLATHDGPDFDRLPAGLKTTLEAP